MKTVNIILCIVIACVGLTMFEINNRKNTGFERGKHPQFEQKHNQWRGGR